jgi:exonuclease SbcD
MKLLCTGDLHLGAGADYGRAPGERLAEQQHVWTDICALAVNENVDAVLFAGDAFERRRPTPAEIMAFRAGLEILNDHEIRCVAIPGNHDVEAFDRPTGLDVLDGIATVYARPAVVDLEDLAIVTLPWTPPSRLVAARNGGDRDVVNREVSELLLETARGLRAQVPAHLPAILLLHWSVSGASLPSGLPVDGLREPVIPALELDEIGFDAFVCGHIHKAQVLVAREENGSHAAAAFYVGSPMPLNFGEAQVGHGVWMLDTDTWVSEFTPIESRPFTTSTRPTADATRSLRFDRRI